MKTMEEYTKVRRMKEKEELSVREIAKQTGFHRQTVNKIIKHGAPPGYRRKGKPSCPLLDPYKPIIDDILKADKDAPRKQKHTAKRIFDRLKEEHKFPGGYTIVKDYVRVVKRKTKEAFVPLEFGPGEAQVDWGESWITQGGEPVKAFMFLMTLPYSGNRFAAAFPRDTMEFFLLGHLMAFKHFDGIPVRIIYDNLKSAVTKIEKKNIKPEDRKSKRPDKRIINAQFEKFRDYYLFEDAFCNVARGNEKGHVEGGVGWIRRNLFVPVPEFTDWDSFNEILAHRCNQYLTHQIRGKVGTVGERFAEEQLYLRPIPQLAHDYKQPKLQPVNSICLARFDTNDYSVPSRYAYHRVVVQSSVSQVRVYHEDECIAIHTRSYDHEQTIYEPRHYLALIEQKPRALDYGAPLKNLQLDECFNLLRRRLEVDQEGGQGTRDYIRVLRLLENHSLCDLTRAVKRAVELGVEDYEAIKNILLCPPERKAPKLDLSNRNHLAVYAIPAPDLSDYDNLTAKYIDYTEIDAGADNNNLCANEVVEGGILR